MLWINKYTALLRSNKGKIVMTIFHRLQGYLVTYIKYFLFLFTLVKFGIYLVMLQTAVLQIFIQT